MRARLAAGQALRCRFFQTGHERRRALRSTQGDETGLEPRNARMSRGSRRTKERCPRPNIFIIEN
ncbi:MAG: hypothetical protein EBS82_01290 [Methylocystaceae bacterium]|nr:hypothetical protein [Methylocystaceae bacterium]